MENAIYIISIKNVKDVWLDRREVYQYVSIFHPLQDRLGDCKILVSPLCECLQFAGLMATSTNSHLHVVHELSPNETENFLEGVPSSLQHTSIYPLLIPDFTSLYEFSQLINYLNEIDSNSIVFVQDSAMLFFNNFVELRKDTTKIGIFRVNYKEIKDFNISECGIKKDCVKIRVKNMKKEYLRGIKLIIKENWQEIGKISEIEDEIKIKIIQSTEKFEKNEKNLLIFQIDPEMDLFGSHICLIHNQKVISNEFHVPEFEISAVLFKDFWYCRLRNNGKNKYPMISLHSGEIENKIDCSDIPIGDFILVKQPTHLLDTQPEFYIKFKGTIISEIFKSLEDDIEI